MMQDSNYVLIDPLSDETPRRNSRCRVGVGIALSSALFGLGLSCATMWGAGDLQPLTDLEPAVTMAWSAVQPGSFRFARVPPISLLSPQWRGNPSVVAHGLPSNIQNRPRQHQGSASSYIDLEIEKEKEAEASAAAALAAWTAAETRAEVAPPEGQFSINFYANTEEADTYKKGNVNWAYLERKIKTALEKNHEKINSVDVRLTAEGHKPKTYRMEATVNHKSGKVIVSKSSHAQKSFIEAVDHMADTLKRNMRKDKEKLIHNKRHAGRESLKSKLDEVGILDEENEIVAP